MKIREAGQGPLSAVLLHGRGSDEADLLGLSGLFPQGSRVVSLRAPHAFGPGYAWYGMDSHGRADQEELGNSVKLIDHFIDEQDPKSPIILLGFSQGGLMAALTGAKRRGRQIRGIAVLSAPPMAQALEDRPLAGIPVFWAHGRDDAVVALARGERMRAMLEEMGAELTAQTYAGGHMVGPQEMEDLAQWVKQIFYV